MSQRQQHHLQHNGNSELATGTSLRPGRLRLGCVALIVVTCVAYLPSIRGGFIFDDDIYLTNAPVILAPDGLYRIWCTSEAVDFYPVTNTTLWLEWRLWGLNPIGYHVTNLVLHIAAVFLIWQILRKLSIRGAYLAALLFAVHPVNVESVAWIAQRKGLLAIVFFLLSIRWYLRWEAGRVPARRERGEGRGMGKWYWLSLLAFVLAMLSKGSVVLLPLMLLGLVWWRRGRITSANFLASLPFFLVTVALSPVIAWFATHGRDEIVRAATFAERLAGAGAVVRFYLSQALLPIHLVFIYPMWKIESGEVRWWLPLVAVAMVTIVLWRHRLAPTTSWARSLLLFWGFFCMALAPVLGFVDTGYMRYSPVADHYQYIATIGVVTLLAAAWSVWRQTAQPAIRPWTIVGATAVVGTFTLLTWQQNRLYTDVITVYQATLEKNPDCWMVHNNFGYALNEAGRRQEAIEHLQQALRLKPDYAEAYNNFGIALAANGQLEEAIRQYQESIRCQPINPNAHNNWGNALTKAGRAAEAIEQFEQALRLKPDYPQAHYNLGNALKQTGRLQEAVDQYQQAIELKPDYAEAYNNLGNVLKQTERFQEALEAYQQALRFKPDYPEIHNNLGFALAHVGRLPEAISHYQQALQLKPNFPEAHLNLGIALASSGRPEEALAHYEQALRLQPENLDTLTNMALAYAQMQRPTEAIAAAEKAIELARLAKQTAQAQQIEDWLTKYRAQQAK